MRLYARYNKKKFGVRLWRRGIDIDQNSIDLAKTRLDKAICADAFEIINDLPENYFDCLICNDFIEHIACPEDFFSKINKCLTKDAVLVASLPNVRYWSNFEKFFFLKDWKYKDKGILDRTHLRFFTKRSMKRSTREWGFKMEKIKGINPTKNPLFYVANIIFLFFIRDMCFLQYGIRARLK